jgi:hypothetical protein
MLQELEGVTLAKPFIIAFVKFVGLVFSAAFGIAFLNDPARPQPIDQQTCAQIQQASNPQAMHAFRRCASTQR